VYLPEGDDIMSWDGLDAHTLDDAFQEVASMGHGTLFMRGVMQPLNVWSLSNGNHPGARPGAIQLDLLADTKEGGFLHIYAGVAPTVYDVPTDLIVASEYASLVRELDDRRYAKWLARVLYITYLHNHFDAGVPDLIAGQDHFSVSFADFHKALPSLHWW
jgi:hypothetical protein